MEKNYILELRDVCKSYQKRVILKNINIALETGKIYGFIGKNGAGKTTTMKIITGLSRPDQGEVYIMGKHELKDLESLRRNIGCIIENPALYQEMSATENLKALCMLYGIEDKERVKEILQLVGLENTGKKKVRYFSLGMRQRLGIGMALINNPRLLVLDEPINGLDPDGIVEVRQLIKKINREKNVTILISSHILNEVYQVVDNYILIKQGEILEQLSQDELEEKCQKYVLIKSGNSSIIKEVLRQKLKTENLVQMHDGSFRVYDYIGNILEVMKAFEGTGIDVNGISIAEDNLEEYFFKKIGE